MGYCQGDPIRLDSSCWDDPGRPECQFGNPTSILWAFDHNQLLLRDILYLMQLLDFALFYFSLSF